MKYLIPLLLLGAINAFAEKPKDEPMSVKCIKQEMTQDKSIEEAYQACSIKPVTK